MNEQLLFLMNGARTKRYHTLTTLTEETVGHHSHGVALLVFMLVEEPSISLIFAALVHDLAEHQTGDLPSPSKRQFGITEQFSALEDRLLETSGWGLEGLTPEEARTLKLADVAQGAMYCAEEIISGNTRMKVVFDRYVSYAEELMLVGFEKTLFNDIKELLK